MSDQTIRRRLVICPHCEGHIKIEIATELSGVCKWEDSERRETPDWWREGLTPDQLAMVETARETGLLEAFSQAVLKREGVSGQPKSIERFLVTFFKTMRQNRVPHFVLKHYIKEFGQTASIETWSAQGLCAVAAGGRIRLFVPLDVFKGRAVSSLVGKNSSRIGGDEETFQIWVKTRFGYVPEKSAAFLSEMRRKSVGEFARPSLSA